MSRSIWWPALVGLGLLQTTAARRAVGMLAVHPAPGTGTGSPTR